MKVAGSLWIKDLLVPPEKLGAPNTFEHFVNNIIEKWTPCLEDYFLQNICSKV